MRILASTVSVAWYDWGLKNGIQASFLSSQDGLVKDDTHRALEGGGVSSRYKLKNLYCKGRKTLLLCQGWNGPKSASVNSLPSSTLEGWFWGVGLGVKNHLDYPLCYTENSLKAAAIASLTPKHRHKTVERKPTNVRVKSSSDGSTTKIATFRN